MIQQVMQGPLRVFGWNRRSLIRTAGAGLVAVVVLLASASVASGQSGGDGLAMTVHEMPTHNGRLVVPLNGSVIVETSKPISRIEVAEATIAKVQTLSATRFVLTGARYGVTQVMVWTEEGEVQVMDIHVELNLELLNETLSSIDPQSDAQAKSIMGNIILIGTVAGPEAAAKMEEMASLFLPRDAGAAMGMIQNHLRVSGEQQVLLRCTVAEVNRNAMRKLGVNGFMAGDDFQDMFVVNQIGGINPANIGAAADVNIQNTIPFLTGEGGIPLLESVPLSLGFPRVQMQLFIDALADNSLLKVLAEPDLVAVSGETASFLAGGEFPVPVPQSGAATGAITIEFREFGVRVNFTPVVLAHQRIRLKVAPEVSETDFTTAVQIQGFVVPGLTQRRVETTVEVGNGQTLAVAGLLSESVRGVAVGCRRWGMFPFLALCSVRWSTSAAKPSWSYW